MDREWLALNLEDEKCGLVERLDENRRIHRKAVRQVLLKWTLLEEWEEVLKKGVNCQQILEKNIQI